MNQNKIQNLEAKFIRVLKENPELMQILYKNPEYFKKLAESARRKAEIIQSDNEEAMDRVLEDDTKLANDIQTLISQSKS